MWIPPEWENKHVSCTASASPTAVGTSRLWLCLCWNTLHVCISFLLVWEFSNFRPFRISWKSKTCHHSSKFGSLTDPAGPLPRPFGPFSRLASPRIITEKTICANICDEVRWSVANTCGSFASIFLIFFHNVIVIILHFCLKIGCIQNIQRENLHGHRQSMITAYTTYYLHLRASSAQVKGTKHAGPEIMPMQGKQGKISVKSRLPTSHTTTR